MNSAAQDDMKFMGESSHPGGQFRDIAVIGRALLNGDVTCRTFSCMGEARVRGTLETGKGNIMGHTTVAGAAAADGLNVMGQMDCQASLRARSLNCMGQLRVKGQLDSEAVTIFGQMEVLGDCNVDEFQSRGAFTIEGLLSVDHLLVRPYGPCRVTEIGGAHLEVRRRGGFLNRLPPWVALRDLLRPGKQRVLEAQVIEGDDIALEDTVAKVVRGARVHIGQGCRIDLVEYREAFTQDPGCEVREARQL